MVDNFKVLQMHDMRDNLMRINMNGIYAMNFLISAAHTQTYTYTYVRTRIAIFLFSLRLTVLLLALILVCLLVQVCMCVYVAEIKALILIETICEP